MTLLIMILLVVGAVLMIIETFLPKLITGILGFLCWMMAVILGYVEIGFRAGNLILVGVLVGLAIRAFCWLKFLPERRIARRFTPLSTVGELSVAKPELLNRTGVTITQLRPSGTAFINGKRLDVVTEGGLIEQGASIKVVDVEGMRVVVREV